MQFASPCRQRCSGGRRSGRSERHILLSANRNHFHFFAMKIRATEWLLQSQLPAAQKKLVTGWIVAEGSSPGSCNLGEQRRALEPKRTLCSIRARLGRHSHHNPVAGGRRRHLRGRTLRWQRRCGVQRSGGRSRLRRGPWRHGMNTNMHGAIGVRRQGANDCLFGRLHGTTKESRRSKRNAKLCMPRLDDLSKHSRRLQPKRLLLFLSFCSLGDNADDHFFGSHRCLCSQR
mmetsp:Transcript_121571/g.278652  ORF Transcript_121571/g.278652 Transcript_121571/m.278652 type:complete len:231 (+) Transcript_121571:2431-3123(+)